MFNNSQTYSDIWQLCLNRIKEQTSAEEFAKWFQPIVPLEFDGTTLRLRVPNASYVYQIEKNYIPFLRPIISQLYGQQTRLHYAVPKAEAPKLDTETDSTAISRFATQNDTANIKNPFIIPGLKRVRIDPQLNPNYTFSTFIEGECNRLARSAGMSVAVNPGTTPFNPLYIYGDSGLGKTHIAQSIGHEVLQRHPELQVLYVSMNKFQAQFQTAHKRGEIPDFIHFYQMIDVLIIDDIQELTGKPGTQNVFFNIFNHLHLSGKQLILTSDKPPVELKDIEDRLLTRFKWGLSTQLNQPDHDTKVKIIRAKAQKMGAQISEEIVQFLADNISANVREIEGALSSLVANASFLGRKITTSLAKEILKAYVQLYQKEITIEHIIEVVCGYLALDPERFNSPERTREIAQARQIAMYLAKQHTKAPLAMIGAAIGGVFGGIVGGIVGISLGLAIHWSSITYDEVPKRTAGGGFSGGGGFGSRTSRAAYQSLQVPPVSSVDLPRLASGAVIPPNREFLAVLGDQRQGMNIEAPAEMIRQMVADGIRAAGIGSGNRSQTVILQVGRRELGRVVYELNKEETQRVGVRLAGVKA